MINLRDRRYFTNIHECDFVKVGGHYEFLDEIEDEELSGVVMEMFVNRQDEDDVWVTFELDSDGSWVDFNLDDIAFPGPEEAQDRLDDMMFPVKFMKVTEGAQLPVYSTSGSAGMDFFAVETEAIKPQESAVIRTGLRIELPEGMELQLRSRSSWRKKGLLGADVGTIDPDYRGEVMFTYWNVGKETAYILVGDKIGQGVLAPVYQGQPVFVEELSETERGEGGFGSTGR